MTTNETCLAAVNVKGEHVGCDEPRDHKGWTHGNAEHEMIWRGSPHDADIFGAYTQAELAALGEQR